MTALLNRCKQLHSRIVNYNTLRRTDKDAEAFRIRANELKTASEALPDLLAKMAVLRESAVRISGTSLKSDQALKAIQALRQKLESDSASIHSGREFGNLRRALEKLAQEMQTIVRDGLNQIVRKLPSVDEVFLRQVEQIPAYAERVRQIRQQRDELLQGREVSSLNSLELREFLRKRETLKELASSIDPAEFPHSVLAFFKSARGSQGAPLEKLTDEVRQWLQERDLLKHVRVMISDR